LQDAPVAGVWVAGYPVPFLELAHDLVHGLRGDEGPARQVGVGQSWFLLEGGQHGVLSDGFAQRRASALCSVAWARLSRCAGLPVVLVTRAQWPRHLARRHHHGLLTGTSA